MEKYCEKQKGLHVTSIDLERAHEQVRGPNSIHIKVLKMLNPHISVSLSILINQSII